MLSVFLLSVVLSEDALSVVDAVFVVSSDFTVDLSSAVLEVLSATSVFLPYFSATSFSIAAIFSRFFS